MFASHWILIVIGIALLCAAIAVGVKNYRWISQAKTAEGKVVELIVKRKKKGKRTYRPKVEYIVDGQLREYISSTGSNPPSHKVGDMVMMAYSDAHGKQTIASFGHVYGFSLIAGMASLGILIGVVLFSNGSKILKWLHPNLG